MTYYEPKFLPLALPSYCFNPTGKPEVEPQIMINVRAIQSISAPSPIIDTLGRVIRYRDKRYRVAYREGREIKSGMATLADLKRLGIDAPALPYPDPADRSDPDPWTGTDADVEQRLAEVAKMFGYTGGAACTSPSLEAAVAELAKTPGTLAHRYYDPQLRQFDWSRPAPEAKETRRRRRG